MQCRVGSNIHCRSLQTAVSRSMMPNGSGEKLSQREIPRRGHLNDKLAAHMVSGLGFQKAQPIGPQNPPGLPRGRSVKSFQDVCQLEGLELWHSQVPTVHQISQLVKEPEPCL